MIDLKQLRELAESYRQDFMTMPAAQVIALLDMTEAAKKDAARYSWLRKYPNNVGQAVYGPTGGLLMRDEYLDSAIDAATAATEGEA